MRDLILGGLALYLGCVGTAAASEAVYATDQAGFIPYWLALEPVTIDSSEAHGRGLEKDYIGEATARPAAGERLTCEGQSVAWKPQAVEDNTAVLDGEATDGARLYVVAYFVAYPVLDQDRELTVLWGSDDSGALFVNGTEVSRHVSWKYAAPDSDMAEKVAFKRGVNVVMLKVLNEACGWSGCARLVDSSGAPLAGIRLAASPDGKEAAPGTWPVVKTTLAPPKIPKLEGKPVTIPPAGPDTPPATAGDAAAPPPTVPTTHRQVGGWADVRGNLAKGRSLQFALLGCPLAKDELVAYVHDDGVWTSTAGGDVWTKAGGDGVHALPHQLLFDPQDPQRFWVSGAYADGHWGPGVFASRDGGATMQRLGYPPQSAGLGVDFSDPERRTLLVGVHESTRSLYLATDGGRKWFKAGKQLPPQSGFSQTMIVVDAKTFLVGCAKWYRNDLENGIFRTEDAGATWSKVADVAADQPPLVRSDGSYIWPCGGGVLVASSDRGKTWSRLAGPAQRSPVELPGGRIAAVGDGRIQVSADGGKTWEPACEPLPDKCSSISYDAMRKTYFTWNDETVYRWDGN